MRASSSLSMVYFCLGEYLFSSAIVAGFVIQPNRRNLILFLIGTMIGSIWEFANMIGGDHLLIVNENVTKYIPPGMYAILHSVDDGALFMLGYLIAYMVNRSKNRVVMFSVMLCFYLLQETIVEVIFTDRVWSYVTSDWNPIIFWIGDRFFTLLPWLYWLGGAVPFYIATEIVPCRRRKKNRAQDRWNRLSTPILTADL